MWKYISFITLLCSDLVFCSGFNQTSKSDDELLFAHIMFRHGARNIAHTFPTDPYQDEKYWPEGLDELANMGKMQSYDLGTYFRQRYSNLIGDGSYHRDKIYVQSIDADRSLMNAEYTLAGLFPPKNEQIWNSALLWQAVPIHTVPSEMDYVLDVRRECPLHAKLFEEYKQSDELQTLLDKNDDLIKHISKHTGIKSPTTSDLKHLYDTLFIEGVSRNFTLPEWTDKIFYPGCKLEELTYIFYTMKTRTKLMKRLRIGFLLRDIFERLRKKENSEVVESLWMYSVHQTVILRLIDGLGLSETKRIPDYTCWLSFELHKSNGQFYVEIYYKPYRGDDKIPFEPLFIPDCGQRCPLKRLYEIYRDIIPTEDFETECQMQ